MFDSNDNMMETVDGNVGLRVNSTFRQNYGSTYLDIDDEIMSNGIKGVSGACRASKVSLGLLSSCSSQHLSMGDVEANSYKLLESNNELDDTSLQVTTHSNLELYRNIFKIIVQILKHFRIFLGSSCSPC